jgi:hypothetical protein
MVKRPDPVVDATGPGLATISQCGTDDDRFSKYHESARLPALAHPMHKERKHHVTPKIDTRPGGIPSLAPSDLVRLGRRGSGEPRCSVSAAEGRAVPAAETAPSALAPAAATPSPDAGLLQLFDQYMAAWSEYRRLLRLEDRMTKKHKVLTPMPEAMLVQPGDAELGLPEARSGSFWAGSYAFRADELEEPKWPVITSIEPPKGTQFYYVKGGQIVYYAPPSAAARARANEIIEANNKWWRKRDRQRPRALRDLERQTRAASKLADRLRGKIDRTRAHTIAGLAVKAQVAAIEGGEDTQFADTTLASILRDMKALNGRALS